MEKSCNRDCRESLLCELTGLVRNYRHLCDDHYRSSGNSHATVMAAKILAQKTGGKFPHFPIPAACKSQPERKSTPESLGQISSFWKNFGESQVEKKLSDDDAGFDRNLTTVFFLIFATLVVVVLSVIFVGFRRFRHGNVYNRFSA